jgi:hypothetical protein
VYQKDFAAYNAFVRSNSGRAKGTEERHARRKLLTHAGRVGTRLALGRTQSLRVAWPGTVPGPFSS